MRLGGEPDQPALMKLEVAAALIGEHVEQPHRYRYNLRANAFAEQHADVVDPGRIERGARHAEGFGQARTRRLIERDRVAGDDHLLIRHWTYFW